MTRIMTAALLAAIAASPAAAADRRFTVTDFDRVQIDGPFEVTLATGKPSAAIASGDQRGLDRVDIDVSGRQLVIRAGLSGWGGYPGEDAGPIRIALTTRNLRGVFVRGPGRLSVDQAEALAFDISLSGTGTIAVDRLDVDQLTVTLIGSGGITAGGEAKTLKAAIQGQGNFDAAKLMVGDAQIEAGTTGNVAVAVERAAKVAASGPGDVIVIGSPACTVSARGSGRVLCSGN